MSSRKTPKLGLHSWEPTDNILRNEFNENFAKLDESAGELKDLRLDSEGVTHGSAKGRIDSEFGKVNEQLAQTTQDVGTIANFKADGTSLSDKAQNEFEVRGISAKWFGAKGDGTDSTSSIRSAITNSDSKGINKILIPSGTHLISGNGIYIDRTITISGSSKDKTILKATTGNVFIFQSISNTSKPNVIIENMTLDCSNISIAGLIFHGAHIESLTIRNCNIINVETQGITCSRITGGVKIEGCTFNNFGIPKGTFINFSSGGKDVSIVNCVFKYYYNAILVDNGNETNIYENMVENFTVDNCYFDGYWWLIRHLGTVGSGSTGQFTDMGNYQKLVDTSANFADVTPGYVNHNIRVMPLLVDSTIDSVNENEIVDNKVNYNTSNVKRGYIIECGNKRSIISGVESNIELKLEGWYDKTTFKQTTPPSTNDSYKVYKVILGEVNRKPNNNTIETDRWWDLDGSTISSNDIPANTKYEIMYKRPNYPIHTEKGTHNAKITNNILKRGWSDQISMYSESAIISNNIVLDGQDMGITVHGNGNVVNGNRVERQGAGGIALSFCYNSVVSANVIKGVGTENNTGAPAVACIAVSDASTGNLLSNNICDGLSLPNAKHGISIMSSGTTQNKLSNNTIINHSAEGILLNTVNHKTVLRDNQATILHANGAVGGDYGTLRGNGSPEGIVTAGIGTTYIRLDGGTGTTFYIKESGTGNTGWVAK